MDKMYLVGVVWYSSDQGDAPNMTEFPQYCFATLEEAEKKYEKLAEFDRRGLGWSQIAYIVEAAPGQPFKTIKGTR